MKISPIFTISVQNNRGKNVVFSSYSSDAPSRRPSILPDRATFKKNVPWVVDSNIRQAVGYLNELTFDESDVKHLQSMGVVLPFQSGKSAVDFIQKSHIGIKFAKLSSDSIHAQYSFDTNCIELNERYKNTQDKAEILAISEAILHEAGHAKDYDGESSIQEEMDCLALNVLGHRVFDKKYHEAFASDDSPIVKDGVCVYCQLFFDEDPLKLALTKRLSQKYGYLPAGDLQHSPSVIALKVKEMQD